jgi:GDP-D-mannose dehydratase
LGDAGKSKTKLGWEPKTKFKELVRIMMVAEFEERGLKASDYII